MEQRNPSLARLAIRPLWESDAIRSLRERAAIEASYWKPWEVAAALAIAAAGAGYIAVNSAIDHSKESANITVSTPVEAGLLGVLPEPGQYAAHK